MHEQAVTRQLELDIARIEKEIDSYTQEKLCYDAQVLMVSLHACIFCSGLNINKLFSNFLLNFFPSLFEVD